MTTIEFNNEYGCLVLVLASSFVSVGSIRLAELPGELTFHGIETAEKIALITGNRGVQIAMEYPVTPEEVGYVIVHESPRSAALARIERLDYSGPAARAEIERRRNS